MKITQPLIDRFLIGACSPEEVNAIVSILSASPDEVDEFFNKKEWDAITFDPALTASETASNELLEKLKQELFKKEKPVAVGHFSGQIRNFAVAAAIMAIVAGVCWWVIPANNRQASIAPANTIHRIPVVQALMQPAWQTRVNTGKKPITVKLEDGSSITIYSNTAVTFQQPFPGNTREIMLNGDALFDVAKNRLKPFIVTSGNLSTTALGTSFRVTTFKQKLEKIRIKLFTGKVVIRSTKEIPGWKQDVFLLPGEELNYDRQTLSARVSLYKDYGPLKANDLAELPIRPPGSELSFNSTPLELVFNQLATMKHTIIHFNNQDIHNMNFTGSISSADDAGTILKLIARMNGLRVIQAGPEFTIEKITKR